MKKTKKINQVTRLTPTKLLKKYEPKEEKRIKRLKQKLKRKQLDNEIINSLILKTILPKIGLKEKKIFEENTITLTTKIIQIEEIIKRNYSKIPCETLTSIILTLAEDFKPIIAKIEEIVDALENNEKETKQKNYSRKAEEIWFPLTTKLGLGENEWKIQDYSFKLSNPKGYEKIKKLIPKTRKERETLITEVIQEVKELIGKKIKTNIVGRPKNFKSVFNKLKKISFKKMYDIYGIRIICEKEKDCYEALGIIHHNYEMIKDAFDDYISKPKKDGYKSIHTAIKRKDEIIEVQIRTLTQHLQISGETYWNYKNITRDSQFEKELSWERQLIEWQKQTNGTKHIQKLVGNKIFVFTPKNDVISLPKKATALDFAFAVHTDIGKKTEKIKINGQYANLETELINLDTVEVITNPKTQMKKKWLQYVTTDKAKNKIRTQFNLSTKPKPIKNKIKPKDEKKIKMAECCHPLPGEDVIGLKTTKRKIIMHKKNCPNVQKFPKEKLIQINFEREKGESGIKVKAIDRDGLLGEMLEEIRKSKTTLKNTSFKIKKTGYVEIMFILEIKNVEKLETLMEKINSIPSVQTTERI